MQQRGTGEQRRIGLVYSGGISKCAYQIGFTKALLKYIDSSEVVAVAGTSMGIFTAYSFSSEKIDLFEWMFKKIDIDRKRELFWRVGFKDLLGDVMRTVCRPTDDLQIPLYFPVSYFPILSVKYYKLCGEFNPLWKKYIAAGSNFPFLKPVPRFIHGRLAFDGGAVDNIPLYPMLHYRDESDFDLIIVLHFDARYDWRRDFSTDIPIIDIDVSICNDFKKDHFDFGREYVMEMLTRAEEYGDGICRELFDGEFTRERLKKTTEAIFMRERAERQRHSSADGWLSVVNRLGKALRSDSDKPIEL